MTGPSMTEKQLALLKALAAHEGWVAPQRLIADGLMPAGSTWGQYVTGAALFRKGLVARRTWMGMTQFAILKAGLDFLKDVERGRVTIR